MYREPSIHVVARSDGVWQVERESGLVAVSLHAKSSQAIDAACALAIREGRGLAIHRQPRRRALEADVVVRAMLKRARLGSPRSFARRAPTKA